MATPLDMVLRSAEWGPWDEADLGPVIRYIRGSTRLRLPQEWRDFDVYVGRLLSQG